MLAERFQMLELCRKENEETVEEVGEDILVDLTQGWEEPPRVLLVERLMSNIEALKTLTTSMTPPRVRLCILDVLLAMYLPGDTSGPGSGYVIIRAEGIMYKSGT